MTFRRRITDVWGIRRLLASPGAFVVLAVAFYACIVLYKAWVCDDAYITFRTIDNWRHGYGLTWNPSERVQPYSNPLWMLLVAALHVVTREFYFTSILLGVTLSLAAVLVVSFGLARSRHMACLAVVVLCFSGAFTDYSTSGLENPLTHFLLALFLCVYLRSEPRPRRLGLLACLCGISLVNRLDLAVLLACPLVHVSLKCRTRQAFGALLAGLAAFWLWEGFSILYYGFPLPNSAYAKLATGIPLVELVPQGLRYLQSSLLADPITILAVAAGASLPFLRRDGRSMAVGAGIVAHLGYVVLIGGDFMRGRFLTAPVLVAAVVLARLDVRPAVGWWLAALAAATLSLLPQRLPFGRRDYGSGLHGPIDAHGVADERAFYDRTTALRRSRGKTSWPKPDDAAMAMVLARTWHRDRLVLGLQRFGIVAESWSPSEEEVSSGKLRPVVIQGTIGFVAFYLGPGYHVLDYHALGDPLLARLPAVNPDPTLPVGIPKLGHLKWRSGHFLRRVPDGYPETLATGENRIRDRDLALYYDKLRLITRGDLWDSERLRTIWDFNLGRYRQSLHRPQAGAPVSGGLDALGRRPGRFHRRATEMPHSAQTP